MEEILEPFVALSSRTSTTPLLAIRLKSNSHETELLGKYESLFRAVKNRKNIWLERMHKILSSKGEQRDQTRLLAFM